MRIRSKTNQHLISIKNTEAPAISIVSNNEDYINQINSLEAEKTTLNTEKMKFKRYAGLLFILTILELVIILCR